MDLVYDAEGNAYTPEEAAAKGVKPVAMVETVYEYTRVHRVAVWAPVGVPAAAVDFFVRNNAEVAYPNKGVVTIREARGEARDSAVSLNLAGRRRI